MILVQIFFLFFSTVADANSDLRQCDTYLDVAKNIECGQENYLVKFGYHYCRKFIEKEHKFTDRGQMILSRIRKCLLDRLVEEPQLSCSNAQDMSENHHLQCYIESGYCEIGAWDQLKLGWMIKKELLSPRFHAVSESIHQYCVLNRK